MKEKKGTIKNPLTVEDLGSLCDCVAAGSAIHVRGYCEAIKKFLKGWQ